MTLSIALVFVVGYAAIAFEHSLKINKAATALLTGVVMWSIYSLAGGGGHELSTQLAEHLADVAGILFFLLGAMTIVELIDAHDGFQIVVDAIGTNDKRRFIAIISFISFFLSSVIDNLTTTIVMLSLARKIVSDREERLLVAGLIVIAANAGGAWSPIGDVTTTMLWIGGQVTTVSLMKQTFLASITCTVIPMLLVMRTARGELIRPAVVPRNENFTVRGRDRNLVFVLGIASLLFVPVFKTITHLPPYMGMLFALGMLWVVTELIHSEKDEEEKGLYSVNHALRKIDTPSVLFFLGILLSVSALQTLGILASVSSWLDGTVGNIDVISLILGGLSAVVDNVPLVAGAQGAYSLERFAPDHSFWALLAYCAGTGGSMLIIGSAAGVAAMGIEKIEFFWYVRRVAWLAVLGYLGGAAVFLAQRALLGH